MKVRMTIEIDLATGMELYDDEERMWAENEIFVGNRELIVHSNEIGDYVGEITKVSNFSWIEDENEQYLTKLK